MTTIPVALLSEKGDKWIRRSSILLIIIVGTSAGLLSWNGLTYLAVNSGVPVGFSWLLALAVDGMILLATAEILHASLTRRSTLFGWLLSAFGVTLSIWGNTAAVSADGIQTAIVHGIAPVSLFLSVELFSRIVKNKITVTQQALEQAAKAAEREAKRRGKEEQKASAPARTTEKESSPATGKQGGAGGSSRISDSDEEVSTYRSIMESLPAEASKASRIEAVLREHPEARSGHIALALGQEIKAVNTTIVRVRERVAKEQKEQSTFTEIVKDFVPTGE